MTLNYRPLVIRKNIKLFTLVILIHVYTLDSAQSVERFYYNGSNQFNGSVQTWTVPTYVSTATVELWGAGGSGGYYYGTCGGSGAYMKGTISVKSGQVVYVVVGAGGLYLEEDTSQIYGGGGYSYYGGTGGGRSAIQFVSGTDIATAAAGAGGTGDDYYYSFYYGNGGAGGYNDTASVGTQGSQNNGWSSGECTNDFGYGATCTVGGAGGLVECEYYNPNSAEKGGLYTGGNATENGGGGGSGYYGGGGGADVYISGGGGGESYPCSSNANLTIITGASGSTVPNTSYQNSRLPPGETSSPNYNVGNPSSIPVGSSIAEPFESNGGSSFYGGNGEVAITFSQYNAINDITENNFLTIEPNPNNGNFNVRWSEDRGHSSGNTTMLKIYNALGHEIFSQTIENADSQTNIPVNISTFAKGIYTLTLDVGQNKFVKKVVVY